MDSANQIIIKFTANFPHLFDNMQKYLPLINNLLQNETQSKFFMETIHEGLLYIYRDFQTFFLMNKPYSPQKIANFLQSTNPKLDPFLLSENIINGVNFPKKGLRFQYKIYGAKSKNVADILHDHFKSFLYEDVERLEHAEYDLVLLLKYYENVIAYNNLVVSMYSGLLTQEINSTEN